MMGRQEEPGQLFYRFNLERHVPPDHLLRRIDAVLDLGAIRRALTPHYATTGRPSVDPRAVQRCEIASILSSSLMPARPAR